MSSSLISTVRDLRLKRGRERRGLALAEGVRLVEEAHAAGLDFRGVLVGPALEATARGKSLKAALAASGVQMHEVSSDALSELADTEHPQGIIAVIAPPRWSLDHITVRPHDTLLVLDGVQDPGNVGTIIRTAFSLGALGVIALPGTADLTNAKVLRSAMGASFRLPAVVAGAADFLTWARSHAVSVWVTAADGEPVHDASRTGPLALVLGNEGAGVSEELRKAASRAVAIPLAEGAESLNVAAAAAILLYEVKRD
ncbi:MAG TPA: RNA methyltransferase [Gemmatimonadales bacterium]|nr:RNA methyltransferase [Gemmatimonadales bacterium]